MRAIVRIYTDEGLLVDQLAVPILPAVMEIQTGQEYVPPHVDGNCVLYGWRLISDARGKDDLGGHARWGLNDSPLTDEADRSSSGE